MGPYRMKYRIDRIETEKATDLLYVLVSFFDVKGEVVHTNDFRMQIIVRNPRDVKEIILSNIEDYIERLNLGSKRGIIIDERIVTETDDRLGLISREVSDLVGKTAVPRLDSGTVGVNSVGDKQ
jgi:hypothetical protein